MHQIKIYDKDGNLKRVVTEEEAGKMHWENYNQKVNGKVQLKVLSPSQQTEIGILAGSAGFNQTYGVRA
jgi:hypothetical protein